MRKYLRLLVSALCIAVISSCTALAPASVGSQPINPGDKVGDVLFTTAAANDVKLVRELKCAPDGTEGKYRCTSKVGNKVSTEAGVYV